MLFGSGNHVCGSSPSAAPPTNGPLSRSVNRAWNGSRAVTQCAATSAGLTWPDTVSPGRPEVGSIVKPRGWPDAVPAASTPVTRTTLVMIVVSRFNIRHSPMCSVAEDGGTHDRRLPRTLSGTHNASAGTIRMVPSGALTCSLLRSSVGAVGGPRWRTSDSTGPHIILERSGYPALGAMECKPPIKSAKQWIRRSFAIHDAHEGLGSARSAVIVTRAIRRSASHFRPSPTATSVALFRLFVGAMRRSDRLPGHRIPDPLESPTRSRRCWHTAGAFDPRRDVGVM